jgi:general secretion pathway protein J
MRNSSGGFALVQLLASLVIVGMLSVLLIQGLSTGRRVWEGLDARASAADTVQTAQTVLRNSIEGAYPSTRYDYGSPYVDFRGASGAMNFIAPPSDQGRPSALRRYSVAVTAGGDLVLTSISDVASDVGAVRQTRVLLKRVQQIDIAYFGAAAPDFMARWRPSWANQPVLPQLVRVRLSLPEGDRRQWPDLLVHPAATIDSDCVLYQGKCRGR